MSDLNPFLNIKRKYNSMYAERTMMFGFLKVVTLFSLSILLIGVGGFIELSGRSKFIPYIIQQDEYGNNRGFVQLDKAPAVNDIDFTKAGADFIKHLRIVTTDSKLQKESMKVVFSHLTENDPAKSKVTNFYTQTPESNPGIRAETETVSVEDIVSLKNTDTTWQVDWTEKRYSSKTGDFVGKPEKKRALLQMYQNEGVNKMKKDDLLRNPHVIFVRDFDWSNVD
jgi:type IV secretion system protein TrbF